MKYIIYTFIFALLAAYTPRQDTKTENRLNGIPLDTLNADILIVEIFNRKGIESYVEIDELKRHIVLTLNFADMQTLFSSIPKIYIIQNQIFADKSIVRDVLTVNKERILFMSQIQGYEDHISVCPFNKDDIGECIEIISAKENMEDSLNNFIKREDAIKLIK